MMASVLKTLLIITNNHDGKAILFYSFAGNRIMVWIHRVWNNACLNRILTCDCWVYGQNSNSAKYLCLYIYYLKVLFISILLYVYYILYACYSILLLYNHIGYTIFSSSSLKLLHGSEIYIPSCMNSALLNKYFYLQNLNIKFCYSLIFIT